MTIKKLIGLLQTHDENLFVGVPACDFCGCATCGIDHEKYFAAITKVRFIRGDELGYHEAIERVNHIELIGESTI